MYLLHWYLISLPRWKEKCIIDCLLGIEQTQICSALVRLLLWSTLQQHGGTKNSKIQNIPSAENNASKTFVLICNSFYFKKSSLSAVVYSLMCRFRVWCKGIHEQSEVTLKINLCPSLTFFFLNSLFILCLNHQYAEPIARIWRCSGGTQHASMHT